MSAIIQTQVFTFDELSIEAKEKARAWYREDNLDYDWWDCVFDDFVDICEMLGIELKTRPVPLMGGGVRHQPCIWFSGFCSQGDGASFEGSYRYAKGSVAKVMAHAPKDEDLLGIAQGLTETQRRNFFGLTATITHRGRYCHAYSMEINVCRDDVAMTEDTEEDVTEALRDLANWLYARLEAEYEYLQSDAAVDESIVMNQYAFTASGKIFE